MQIKLEEYEARIIQMTHNHGMEIEQMLEERREMAAAMEDMVQDPVQIRKQWVKTIGKR